MWLDTRQVPKEVISVIQKSTDSNYCYSLLGNTQSLAGNWLSLIFEYDCSLATLVLVHFVIEWDKILLKYLIKWYGFRKYLNTYCNPKSTPTVLQY